MAECLAKLSKHYELILFTASHKFYAEKVMELMFNLNREQGTTLVLVTHDNAIAERCDRRITIEAGQVMSA